MKIEIEKEGGINIRNDKHGRIGKFGKEVFDVLDGVVVRVRHFLEGWIAMFGRKVDPQNFCGRSMR